MLPARLLLQKDVLCAAVRLLKHLDFPSDHVVDQGFAEFLKRLDLGGDGGDYLIDLGGFGVEIGGDGLLFAVRGNWHQRISNY